MALAPTKLVGRVYPKKLKLRKAWAAIQAYLLKNEKMQKFHIKFTTEGKSVGKAKITIVAKGVEVGSATLQKNSIWFKLGAGKRVDHDITKSIQIKKDKALRRDIAKTIGILVEKNSKGSKKAGKKGGKSSRSEAARKAWESRNKGKKGKKGKHAEASKKHKKSDEDEEEE
jgi:hypothetical protein